MIKEAYVSYEVAKLLKEKGFDECIFEFYEGYKIKYARNGKGFRLSELGSDMYYPHITHQMTMAWLREVYNIFISIQPDFPSDKDYKMCWCWTADILHENCISLKGYQNYIETYDEAVEAALKYCLKNLI